MRTSTILFLAAILAAAACSREAGGGSRLKAADRKAIEALITKKAENARRAWEERDARIMVPDSATVGIRSPEGQVVTPAQLRDDLQRRMDGVARIDTMSLVIDSLRVVTPDSVVAYSTERFVRVLRRSDGAERQRFSVGHYVQPFARRNNVWIAAGPETAINPKSWWGDEAPPSD